MIAVLNASAKVTNAEASTMTRAVAWQARHHIAPAWQLDPPAVIFYRAPTDVPPGAVVALIADNADVAGALGYHDQGPDGRPYLRVFVDVTLSAGGTVLGPAVHAWTGPTDEPVPIAGGALSVSTVLSHEVAEFMGDPECNRWAQRADGRLICLELGDPVQDSGYQVLVTTGHRRELVAVSNFVHPAWFDTAPEVGARFDELRQLAHPFTLSAGGYQIWTDGSSYGNEFGSATAAAKLAAVAADKLHPMARTRRRYEALERLGAAPDPRPTGPPIPPASSS